METHLNIIGVLFIALALVHIVFPRYFKWDKELRSLSLINRQMMRIHTFFIALSVLLMGLLCVTSSADLIHTALGNRISLGLGVFWTIRLVIQFVGYSPELWKGKRFETAMHFVLSLLWAYVSLIFLRVYFH